MHFSYKEIDTQLGRKYQNNIKHQSFRDIDDESNGDLPENKNSVTGKVKLCVNRYFFTHFIATTSSLGGILGATFRGASRFALGNLMLGSTTVIVPIGITIGAMVGMSSVQKMMYKTGVNILTNGSAEYLPIPNPSKVQKEIRLLEKINCLRRTRMEAEFEIYHNSTLPLIMGKILSQEEIRNGFMDAMNNQEVEELLNLDFAKF